jgi:hypothetical protein
MQSAEARLNSTRSHRGSVPAWGVYMHILYGLPELCSSATVCCVSYTPIYAHTNALCEHVERGTQKPKNQNQKPGPGRVSGAGATYTYTRIDMSGKEQWSSRVSANGL